MTLDLGNTDKLNVISARSWTGSASRLLPPDINRSEVTFAVEPDPKTGKPAIRYALAAVKGSARRRWRELVAERARGGRFEDLSDFVAPARRQELQPPAVREPRQGRRVRHA